MGGDQLAERIELLNWEDDAGSHQGEGRSRWTESVRSDQEYVDHTEEKDGPRGVRVRRVGAHWGDERVVEEERGEETTAKYQSQHRSDYR